MRFADLGLEPVLLAAVEAQGYEHPTPIQRKAIPPVLEGKDLVGIAQTGTGKTAAFTLPLLQRLLHRRDLATRHKVIRVLVLTPTREFASQIDEAFRKYGAGSKLRSMVLFGGVGQNPQVQSLKRGVDVLVATPGRLLNLLEQGYVNLSGLDAFVLDEADRMLDMGFIHDVKKVIKVLPRERQTLLFSATMPADIDALARNILQDPARVTVTPPATTVELIEQSVFFVEKGDKPSLLLHLLADPDVKRVLVFTRTKHGANRVAETLVKKGIAAAAIHGNKSQGARERALDGFKAGTVRALVATDIAARGIDVDEITHVIQFDLPEVPDQYVHRIGRTARAGAAGIAWTFCSVDDRPLLVDVERTIRRKVDVVEDNPYRSTVPAGQMPTGPRPTSRGQQRSSRPGSSAPPGPRGPRRRRGGSGGGRGSGAPRGGSR